MTQDLAYSKCRAEVLEQEWSSDSDDGPVWSVLSASDKVRVRVAQLHCRVVAWAVRYMGGPAGGKWGKEISPHSPPTPWAIQLS